MPEAVMSEETKNTMKQRLGKLILSRNILEYKRHVIALAPAQGVSKNGSWGDV